MENFYLHSYKYFLNGMLRTLVTLENPKIPFDTKWFNLMFGTLYTTCFQTTRVKSDARFFSQWFGAVKQSKSIRNQGVPVILYVPPSKRPFKKQRMEKRIAEESEIHLNQSEAKVNTSSRPKKRGKPPATWSRLLSGVSL